MKATSWIEKFGMRVALFGVSTGDWSLRGKANREELKCVKHVTDKMGAVVSEQAVHRVFAPIVSKCNAEVAHESEFTDEEVPINGSAVLNRGKWADGVVLRKGDAFFVGSADCATVVVTSVATGNTAAAHAARDSLVDRAFLEGKAPPRRHFSVVHGLLEQFDEPVRNLRALIVGSAGPDAFPHPWDHHKHGERNRILIEFLVNTLGSSCVKGDPQRGKLVLHEIIRLQLMARGLHPEHIWYDGRDTVVEKHSDGTYVWWSHIRDQHVRSGERNGVFVFRSH